MQKIIDFRLILLPVVVPGGYWSLWVRRLTHGSFFFYTKYTAGKYRIHEFQFQ